MILFSVLILFGILLVIQVMDEIGGTWRTNWEMTLQSESLKERAPTHSTHERPA